MSSSNDSFHKYSIADEAEKELSSPFIDEAWFIDEEADEEWEMRLMELQTPFLDGFGDRYEFSIEREEEESDSSYYEIDEEEFEEEEPFDEEEEPFDSYDSYLLEEEETLEEEESDSSYYEMDEDEFDEEEPFDSYDSYLLEEKETLEEEESDSSYYKMDEDEFDEEIGKTINDDFTADELEWQNLVAHELTQKDRNRLFRQILRTAGLRNLRNLYGLDSAKKVLAHLRNIFVGRDRSLIEIRREVLKAKYLRGKQRRKELLLYLKQIAVLDLYSQIQKTTKVSVDKDILIDLPSDELGRIHNLIRDNEEEEIIRRFRTYKQAQQAMRRASNVTKADLKQERMKVASKRGISKPGEIRAASSLSYYLHRHIMIHAFGAADAYGIDPYMLLGIFFQEIRSTTRKKLMRNPRLSKIDSFNDYGLDNAYTLRGERERRKELQLGKLEEIIKVFNENEQEVKSAYIYGLRDIFYYSAAEVRRFQDRVISDFNKAGLEKPKASTLITWILIYWNGGQGKSNETISSCNKRLRRIARRRRSGEKVRGIGGWCRLQFAIKSGDVLTILDDRRLTSSRPYLYANRVMGSIETLIRLNIAEVTSSHNEEELGKFLSEAYIEEFEEFDELDEMHHDKEFGEQEEIDEYEFEADLYDNKVDEDLDKEEFDEEFDAHTSNEELDEEKQEAENFNKLPNKLIEDQLSRSRLKRAVNGNPRWSRKLGWKKDKVATFLARCFCISPPITDQEFANLVARWQRRQGMKRSQIDGIIGRVTWKSLEGAIVDNKCSNSRLTRMTTRDVFLHVYFPIVVKPYYTDGKFFDWVRGQRQGSCSKRKPFCSQWEQIGINLHFINNSKSAEDDLELSLGTPGAIVIYFGHTADIRPRKTGGLDPEGIEQVTIKSSRLQQMIESSSAKLVVLAGCSTDRCFTKITKNDIVVVVTVSGDDDVTSSQIWAPPIKALLDALLKLDTICNAVKKANKEFADPSDSFRIINGDSSIKLI